MKGEKTLVIKIDWWLWRCIAMTWAITEVAKQRPVKVITTWPAAFWWNPYIRDVYGIDEQKLYENVVKGNDYFELEPYTDSRFFNDWVNRLEIASSKLWLDIIAEPVIYLAEHEKLDNVLGWEKPVLFQPFWSSMNSNWADKSYRSLRVNDAQYIADVLNSLWYTVYVLERDDQPKLMWCEQLTARSSRWLISLADRYPLIWVDSCMHHAAKAFWKQSVVIRSGTDAGRFWYNTHINLRNNEPYEYVPFRLWIDFNTDIVNQHTNIFDKSFLDTAIDMFVKMYEWNQIANNLTD